MNVNEVESCRENEYQAKMCGALQRNQIKLKLHFFVPTVLIVRVFELNTGGGLFGNSRS